MESYQKPSEPRKFFVCALKFPISERLFALGVPVFQLFSQRNHSPSLPDLLTRRLRMRRVHHPAVLMAAGVLARLLRGLFYSPATGRFGPSARGRFIARLVRALLFPRWMHSKQRYQPMNKPLLFLLFLLFGLEPAVAQPPQVATAHLEPIGGSGITADLTFRDHKGVLTVSGTGTGFNPVKHYHTLIYDADAQPSGPRACIPSGTAAFPFSTDQMQIGAWQPIGSRTRTLSGVRRGAAFLPLDVIGVVSVRRHDQTGATVQLVLQSCGDVVPR